MFQSQPLKGAETFTVTLEFWIISFDLTTNRKLMFVTHYTLGGQLTGCRRWIEGAQWSGKWSPRTDPCCCP